MQTTRRLEPSAIGISGQQLGDAASTLGLHLRRYRTAVLGISQEEMVRRLSDRLSRISGKEGGLCRTTYRKMETGDPRVNFTYWLAAFQEFGLLADIVRAAEPAHEAFNQMVSTIPGYDGP